MDPVRANFSLWETIQRAEDALSRCDDARLKEIAMEIGDLSQELPPAGLRLEEGFEMEAAGFGRLLCATKENGRILRALRSEPVRLEYRPFADTDAADAGALY